MDNLNNISLKQLQYFAAVAEFGSFRQAAFRLGITQPTLSNQIAIMEKALKIHLFERTRKGINNPPRARVTPERAKGFRGGSRVYITIHNIVWRWHRNF